MAVADLAKLNIDQLWRIGSCVTKGYRFEIPTRCKECRSFDSAVASEPSGSVWVAKRVAIVGRYRMIHHDPRLAFVDRQTEFMKWAARVFKSELARDVARFLIMAEQMTEQREKS